VLAPSREHLHPLRRTEYARRKVHPRPDHGHAALAGVFAITRMRFALYDFAGVLLWAGTWLALGYFFSDAIVLIAAKASALGRVLGLVIVAALAGYILVKYGRRRLFLRQIQTIRVQAAARRRLDVTVIDRATTELRLSERAAPSRSSAPP
jgi:hypothetical protein